MKNTRIWYQYSNKVNKKAVDYFVVSGRLTEDITAELNRTLAKGHLFIPAQVCIKSLAGSSDDDHVWHHIDLSSAQPTMEKPMSGIDGQPMSVGDLVDTFSSTIWNPAAETARMFNIPEQQTAKVSRLSPSY